METNTPWERETFPDDLSSIYQHTGSDSQNPLTSAAIVDNNNNNIGSIPLAHYPADHPSRQSGVRFGSEPEPERAPNAHPSTPNPNAPHRSLSQRIARSFSLRRGATSLPNTRIIPIIPLRTTPLNNPLTGKLYPANGITTARYTFYDFLPKQLYAQFSKVANTYFLFVAAIQMVPGWSPTGQYTTIFPLALFMAIAMAHEGYDDLRRHRADKTENNKVAQVLRVYHGGGAENGADGVRASVWQKVKWSEVRMGDFVRVDQNEWIPADLLLLYSSGEEGTCYVETAALDGETNLKQRQALKETNTMLVSPEALGQFE
ncbi:hypothetical protein BC937DRAFT_87642, partial [Endogone sp. FLAS-F59071]